MMSKGEVYGDMTGQRFGRWTVLGMTARTSTDGLKKRPGKGQERMRAEDFEAMFPENGGSPASKDGRASQLNPLFVGEMMGYPLEWLTSPFLSGDGEGRP